MISIVPIDIYHASVVFLSDISVHDFDTLYYENTTRITDEEYKGIREDIVNPKICNGSTWKLDNGNVIVFVRYSDLEEDVAHEIFHAANDILLRAGINLDADGEPWAYLIGYLTRKFYEALKDK